MVSNTHSRSLSSLDRVSCFLLGAASSAAVGVAWMYYSSRHRRPTNKDGSTTNQSSSVLRDAPDLELRLLRKAEAVIQGRTTAVTVVIERCTNDHNYSAILRTVEALGVQCVAVIDPPALDQNDNDNNDKNRPQGRPQPTATAHEAEQRALHHLFAQNATAWLTLTEYRTTSDCIESLKATGHTLWVTDLSQEAVPLTHEDLSEAASNGASVFPDKLALVFGTEAVGCSQELLDAADLRVYLPLRGFADSLNLSVAAALVLQCVLTLHPDYIGQATEAERHALRQAWFPKLAEQRLLGHAEKRERKRLQRDVQKCQDLQDQVDRGVVLHKEQAAKLARRPDYTARLAELDDKAATKTSMQYYIDHPPEPLGDLRRPDEHRVTFVGKSTKRYHQDHWKDMAAVSHVQSVPGATANFFRAAAGNEDTDA